MSVSESLEGQYMKTKLIKKKHSEELIIWAMCEYRKYIMRMEKPLSTRERYY